MEQNLIQINGGSIMGDSAIICDEVINVDLKLSPKDEDDDET